MERGLDAVGRLVYRTLLRTAKEFDKHSVLKALITRQHLNELPAEVQQVASAFLGGPDRVFFWPAPTLPQSVVTAVQMGFRFPPSAVNLDAAFSAMRYLQGLTSIGRKHGLLGVLPNGESVGLQQLSIPEPGALLIPHPLLPGFFERAVVLLLQHSPMQGSLGLCLNRPIAGDSKTLADVAELAPFIQADQSASTPDDPAMHSMASMADDDWSDAEAVDEEGEQMLPLREAVRMILAPAGQEAASTKEADEADVDDLMDRSIVVEYILSPVEREDEDSVFRRGRGGPFDGRSPSPAAVADALRHFADQLDSPRGITTSSRPQHAWPCPNDNESASDLIGTPHKQQSSGAAVSMGQQLGRRRRPFRFRHSGMSYTWRRSPQRIRSRSATAPHTTASLAGAGGEAACGMLQDPSQGTQAGSCSSQQDGQLAQHSPDPEPVELDDLGQPLTSSSEAVEAPGPVNEEVGKAKDVQSGSWPMRVTAAPQQLLGGSAASSLAASTPGTTPCDESGQLSSTASSSGAPFPHHAGRVSSMASSSEVDDNIASTSHATISDPAASVSSMASGSQLDNDGRQQQQQQLTHGSSAATSSGATAGSSEAAGQAPQQTAVSPSVHTTAEIMEAFTDSPVFIGGPCHGLQVLHSSEELQQASPAHGVPLSQLYNVPLYAGADLQRGKELLSQGRLAPGDVRFFLGEAQWEGGQLERELAEGSWLLAPLPAPLTALLDLIPPDRPEVARRTMPDGLPQSSDTLWSIMMTSLSPEHAQLMHIVPAVRKDLAEMEF